MTKDLIGHICPSNNVDRCKKADCDKCENNLEDLVHEFAMKVRKDTLAAVKEQLEARRDWDNQIYALAIRHCIEIVELMEKGNEHMG